MPTQCGGWIRLTGHSAPRLSPALRAPPLCRYAERPAKLILHMGIVIAGRWFVIAGLTRNPVCACHWIPGRARDDKHQVRDDQLASEFSDNRPMLGKNLQQFLSLRQTEIGKVKTRCHGAANEGKRATVGNA